MDAIDAATRSPKECEDRHCPNGETFVMLVMASRSLIDSDPGGVMKYNGTCYCEKFPHLDYEFDANGKLTCYCTKNCPHGFCAGQRKPVKCVQENKHCPKKEHPILALENGECICKTHPCAATKQATCDSEMFPMLDYSYDENGKLDCFCRRHPCPAFACHTNPETPVIAWDQEGNCFCQAKEHNEL
ncbi:hypothetical protein GUITHDRAFT_105238 [Guillardia theta CCMP2712]|uniref:Uncharacterized protein n=1 Tax=Guillardia theta (strain CCMP2712) TaxID=905079 RepID=L1JKY2_GUITC|nr:hypothetical protein GUITHDRAFT_105238 [Guillardia theta CCMP2712]EKX49163.1 hypothetical protein GUITHDRAFT_105238 [Guillardia theta CCMP2712]|eukprot:XP_005836143.1 hypothetical protein GUITHDRAFT_105238 [Guillardia theta CCMP2712]